MYTFIKNIKAHLEFILRELLGIYCEAATGSRIINFGGLIIAHAPGMDSSHGGLFYLNQNELKTWYRQKARKEMTRIDLLEKSSVNSERDYTLSWTQTF